MDEDVGAGDLTVVEETALGGDLRALRADLHELLVELGPLVVPELSGSGDGSPDVPGPLGAQVADAAAVLAVLVRQQLDAEPLGDSLESLPLGHRDDVDEAALGREVVDADLGAQDGLGVLDPLVDAASADPQLHQVGDLLGHALHQLGLGVGEDADILHVDAVVLGEGGLVVVLGHGQALGQQGVQVVCPDLAGGLQPVHGVLVESHCRDLHGRDLQHRHRHLELHPGGRALRALIDYESVRHTGLVAGESLDLGCPGYLGPRIQPGGLRLRPLARAVRAGPPFRTSPL